VRKIEKRENETKGEKKREKGRMREKHRKR
jgi:hypothetical protein